MRFLFVAVFCTVLAYVASETCSSVGDCSHVTCDAGHDLECHLRQCTCTDYQQDSCTVAAQCSGNCRFNRWHCVDGRCRCGFNLGK